MTVDWRSIRAHEGDQRAAFEELSCQLFAREYLSRGEFIRRHGAGGDAGLEGVIVDSDGRTVLGIQAKFFTDKLGSTQWNDLDRSIRTAVKDNRDDRLLEEVIVTLPRNLTQAQFKKWIALRKEWVTEARRAKYPRPVAFTLWDDSRIRGMLLAAANRGLLLYYFGHPNFDAAHCRARSEATVAGLGDRYLPHLHSATAAQDKLHVFLRSERSRQQFVERARENAPSRGPIRRPNSEFTEGLTAEFEVADAAWQKALPLFGDGISLPRSFTALANALDSAAEALEPLMKKLHGLIPPREPRRDEDYYSPQTRGPQEELLRRLDRREWHLRSLARYLRENALADQPCLLLAGEPGAGKTHVLAEVCSRYSEQGGVVLFTEGAMFSTDEPPWTQFTRWAGFSGNTPRDFIDTLAAIAAQTSLPALICIDALNESPNRALWRHGLIDFAAEFRNGDRVKLLVSCRKDYLAQTLPKSLHHERAPGWAFAEHEGLGLEVFEAFPKYVAAYDVRWFGLPPLVEEFRNPLFLRIFCEAYAGRTPDPGSLSMGTILRHYAQRKAELLGRRIDCDPSRVLDALRDIAEQTRASATLQIDERAARALCERHHSPSETSRSLYRAFLSEGVLAEFPGQSDPLGTTHLVRFTYERVWDYFICLSLLPIGSSPSAELITKLRDENWRWANAGLVSLLTVRFPEEGHGEL